MQPATGDQFHDIEDHLPLAEGIKIRRHRPDVVRISGEPDQMVAQTKQFAEHDADHPGSSRNGYICKGFHRQQIGKIIGRTCQIVHPRQIRNKLVPGLTLADFFHPSMVVSDIHIKIDNFFAVQRGDVPQQTVSADVMGTDV